MIATLTATMIVGNDRRERIHRTLRHLSRTGEVPTLPQTATAALAVARDPVASADELCGVIRTDMGLAARILHVVNSAAYARRTPARTLRDAVVALGLRKTCDILVAACFRQLSVASGPHAQVLWNHALAVAIAAEELARMTRTVEPGAGFLPGLFHDVGRVAFFLADAMSVEVIQGLADAGAGERTVLEHEWYGFDHAEAGALLAEEWGLVPEQCDAIRWHHDPTQAEAGRTLAPLLSAADRLAYTIGCGTGAAQPTVIETNRLGLSPEDEARCTERVHATFVQENELLA
jgi:HD-like signal output (HDOD) protein